jgi:small subunit ribosomal protein S6
MRHYEATVVLDPTLGDDGFAKHVDRIVGSIEKQGGSMLTDDRWGLRKLAYSIKKQDQGFYAVLEWEGPGAAIAELDRLLRLDENVLRHLVIHMDPKQLAVREEQRRNKAAGIESRGPDRERARDEKVDFDDETIAEVELETAAPVSVEADVSAPEEDAAAPEETVTAESADEADAAETADEAGAAESADEADAAETADEADTAESADEADAAETADEAGAGESADEADAGETADTSGEEEAGEEPSDSVEGEDETAKESE